jgi:hypothetical protein
MLLTIYTWTTDVCGAFFDRHFLYYMERISISATLDAHFEKNRPSRPHLIATDI